MNMINFSIFLLLHLLLRRIYILRSRLHFRCKYGCPLLLLPVGTFDGFIIPLFLIGEPGCTNSSRIFSIWRLKFLRDAKQVYFIWACIFRIPKYRYIHTKFPREFLFTYLMKHHKTSKIYLTFIPLEIIQLCYSGLTMYSVTESNIYYAFSGNGRQ